MTSVTSYVGGINIWGCVCVHLLTWPLTHSPPLSLFLASECFPSLSTRFVWWRDPVRRWRMDSLVVGWWWWSWWWRTTEWCVGSFGTVWGRCACRGIVWEGANSSDVRETLWSSDGEAGVGGRTSAETGSVSESPMGSTWGSDKILVENTTSVSEGELISALWRLLHELHEDRGCKCNEEQAG